MLKVSIPTECPSCNSTLDRVKDQLFCRNPNCEDVVKSKILHYAKTLQIKGLGEKTIEKLELGSIKDIYLLTEDFVSEKLGEKLGSKLITEIEKSKRLPLDKFIAAMSIPLIGIGTARKLAGVINTPEEITKDVCIAAGIGPKATSNLLEWAEAFEPLPISFTKPKASNYKVCISGKIPGYTKNSLALKLGEYNIEVVNNVNKQIKYLIVPSKEYSSSKLKKALELGIEVLTWNELEEKLNEQ